MSVIELKGASAVHVTLRRSAQARRMTLRVSGIDNRVTLTVPRGVSDSAARDFVHAKESWIRSKIAGHIAPRQVGLGDLIPLEGTETEIIASTERRVRLTAAGLAVPGDTGKIGARIKGYLKTLAQARCAAAVDVYATRLGKHPSGLSLRDTRSRWGSCTSEGRLMLSWRLILAPPEMLRYVVAHEVAHLAEMNHSPAFWATVEHIHGPYAVQRRWLREEGAGLHRYRFGD